MLHEVPIISVNSGPIALLGSRADRRGVVRDVYSGIRKAPIIGGTDVYLGWEGLRNLDGSRLDFQADERVHKGQRIHGGPLKAVYGYPRDHYELWIPEMSRVLVPGNFGENLTLGDITEDRVVIGELWEWGEAILEVTEPRRPCHKLDMLRGDGTALAMMQNGRCGWYFKVIRPGKVPTTGVMQVISRPGVGLTIAEAFHRKVRANPVVPDMPDD